MNSFDMLDRAALEGRVERLKLEERNLGERVTKRVNALEAQDRWHKSDPLYQRLAYVLQRTREDLRDAEEQLLEGADKRTRRDVSAPARRMKRRSYAPSIGRYLQGFTRRGKWQAP